MFSVTACDRCGGAQTPQDAAPEGRAPEVVEAAASDAAPPPLVDAAPLDAAPLDAALGDGGAFACRLVYGPAEQPFRGPAALLVTRTELKLVANDSGKPRIYPVPLAAPPPASAPAVMPEGPGSVVGMRWPACELAGKWVYCQAAGGIVYRTTLGGKDTKQIAKSRASTRIAAAALGSDHSVLATLDVRHTTEGERLQAFVTLDDGETTRLSEEGAGATVLRLVPRGSGAVAFYLDSHTSMVPVHARPLSLKGSDLALADDAVVFVAGPPERAVDFTVASGAGSMFALLPIGRDSLEFGMAAIPISDPPKLDIQPVWSMYPNGLDPAAIAGTTGGDDPPFVARVRPAERAAGSPRILELGRLDPTGTFHSLGTIATGKSITEVSIARDGYGAVWILYGDTKATWLERRVCP